MRTITTKLVEEIKSIGIIPLVIGHPNYAWPSIVRVDLLELGRIDHDST
jgi:hypothetical protein